MKKMSTIILAIAIAITFMPMPGGEAHAAKTKKPAKVTGVKVVAKTTSSVTLKWKKAKRTKKYQVFIKKGSKFKKIKTTKKIKVTIKKLKAGTKYKFKIRGINGKKKGKYSKILGVKTKKKSTVSSSSNKNPSGVNISKKLNERPKNFQNDVPSDINCNKIIESSRYAEYKPTLNTNEFSFWFKSGSDFSNVSINVFDSTPKKVKDFFGEFYKPSTTLIKSVKTHTASTGNIEIVVSTDPFVSDVYLYASDKNGKVVYGDKLGWNYGTTKYQSNKAMFLWAKPKNDVFKKMYDNARKKILAKVAKPGDTFRNQYIPYEEYMAKIVCFIHERYDITKFGKWLPGYVTFNCGIDVRDDSTLSDYDRHDESTKYYIASSNFQYFSMLGLESHTCQVSHDVLIDDMARDIDPKVNITYNIRSIQNRDHVGLNLSFSDNTFCPSDIMTGCPDTIFTKDRWDSNLQNIPECRENFKAQVPNWEVWDIL